MALYWESGSKLNGGELRVFGGKGFDWLPKILCLYYNQSEYSTETKEFMNELGLLRYPMKTFQVGTREGVYSPPNAFT